MIEHPAPGEPVSTSPDFPVKWDRPGDADLYWEMELMHNPDPVTLLEFEFGAKTHVYGLNHAAETYELPVRFDVRRINGYVYQAITGARPGQYMEKMDPVMARGLLG